MPQKTRNKTTDHDEIRRWAESRGGHPALVKGPDSPISRKSKDSDSAYRAGLLRIAFDEPVFEVKQDDEMLEEISWDQFFEKFDEKKLVFAYQDRSVEEPESRFFRFERRSTTDKKSRSGAKAKRGSKSGRTRSLKLH